MTQDTVFKVVVVLAALFFLVTGYFIWTTGALIWTVLWTAGLLATILVTQGVFNRK